jgi:hypothetical protein
LYRVRAMRPHDIVARANQRTIERARRYVWAHDATQTGFIEKHRDRAIRILPKRTRAIPRIRPTLGSTTGTAIGAQAAMGRAALGVKRAGVAAIVVLLARMAGLIAEGRTRVVSDLTAATVLAEVSARAAAVQGGTEEPTIAGLDHTAVIDSHTWRPPTRPKSAPHTRHGPPMASGLVPCLLQRSVTVSVPAAVLRSEERCRAPASCYGKETVVAR